VGLVFRERICNPSLQRRFFQVQGSAHPSLRQRVRLFILALVCSRSLLRAMRPAPPLMGQSGTTTYTDTNIVWQRTVLLSRGRGRLN